MKQLISIVLIAVILPIAFAQSYSRSEVEKDEKSQAYAFVPDECIVDDSGKGIILDPVCVKKNVSHLNLDYTKVACEGGGTRGGHTIVPVRDSNSESQGTVVF